MSHVHAYNHSTLIYRPWRSRTRGTVPCYLLLLLRGRRVGGDAAACGRRGKRVVDMATLSALAPAPSISFGRRTGPRRVSLVYAVSLSRVRFFLVASPAWAPTTSDISASSSPWICGSRPIMPGVDYRKGHTEFVGLMWGK